MVAAVAQKNAAGTDYNPRRMRIGAIVQARMSSTRLPDKVLRRVRDRPVLQYLLERLQRCDGLERVSVATSVNPSDEPIEKFCLEFGVSCCRGPMDDVARRCAEAAASHGLDAFVRLCADSPLLDPALVDGAVAQYRSRAVDLVTNVFPRSFPPGQSVEVIRTSELVRAVHVMTSADDRQHVTRYFYRHADRYRIHNICSDMDYGDLVLAIDTPGDLHRFETLVAGFERPHWEYGLRELAQLQPSAS